MELIEFLHSKKMTMDSFRNLSDQDQIELIDEYVRERIWEEDEKRSKARLWPAR